MPKHLFSLEPDLTAVAVMKPAVGSSPRRSVVDAPPAVLHFVETAGDAGAAFDAPELFPEITRGELERAARFRRRGDARNHLAGRWLARGALAPLLGLAPVDVGIVLSKRGRPEVPGGAGPYVSISHTDGIAICAVARSGVVGVDVEAFDRAADMEQVAKMFVGEVERAMLDALAPEDRPRALLALWTLKEAYGKALGHGIAVSLTDVVFRPDFDGRPKLLAPDGAHWRFRLAPLCGRWLVACVARI